MSLDGPPDLSAGLLGFASTPFGGAPDSGKGAVADGKITDNSKVDGGVSETCREGRAGRQEIALWTT
jgi:hypothetical protein